MPRFSFVASLVLAGALGLAQTASASPIVTVDFEELSVDDGLLHFVGSTYSSDGFTFTASVLPEVDNDPGFNTVGPLSSSFAGSTSLENLNGFGVTTLTQSDGGLFNLFAIDLAEMPNFYEGGSPPVDLGSFTLTFFGARANGSTVQATATIDAFPAVTTYTFAGFTNLTSVQWSQGGGGLGSGLTHQFDNVRVQAVPEPSTLALLGVGILVALRTRKRSSRVPRRSSISGPAFSD